MFQGPEFPLWACEWQQAELAVIQNIFVKQKGQLHLNLFSWDPLRWLRALAVGTLDMVYFAFSSSSQMHFIPIDICIVNQMTNRPQFACHLSCNPCAISEVYSAPLLIQVDHTNHSRSYDELRWLHILLCLLKFIWFVRASST